MPVELLPDLLVRCRRGDADALDTLIRRFHPYATTLAGSYLSRPDQIDDAVQSAFVAVLSHLGDLRTPDAFPGWFRQVVRTQCTRLTRQRDPAALLDQRAALNSNPYEQSARADLLARIRLAVCDLPPAQRDAAQLFYLDDLSQRDVARTLDIPEGTVKRRLHDARNRLRTTLKAQFPI